MSLFERCTEHKRLRDKTHEIHCKLGLWSVSGKNLNDVKREALHYWVQYLRDGEYDELLSK